MNEDGLKPILKDDKPPKITTEDDPHSTTTKDEPQSTVTEEDPKSTMTGDDPKSDRTAGDSQTPMIEEDAKSTTDDDRKSITMQGSDVQPSHVPVHPDGGWGWVVCVASMICYGTVGILIGTFSILYVAMLDKYGKDDDNISAKTAQVGSFFQGLTCFSCPIASLISGRIGIRQTGALGGVFATTGLIASAFVEEVTLLYFTYSTLIGLGAGFVYGQSYVILSHYFKRRLGFVSGLYFLSTPAFTIAMTLVLPSLLSNIGLRYTLISMAGLSLLWIPCSLTWIPLLGPLGVNVEAGDPMLKENSSEGKAKPSGSRSAKFCDLSIWKNKPYVLWLVSLGITMIGYFVPLVHMVKYSEDIFPDNDGTHLVLALYVGSGLFRFLVGKLTDFNWVSPIVINQVSLLIMAGCYISMPLVKNFIGVLALSFVIGACDGCLFCLLGLITIRIVGHGSASQGYGFMWGMMSLPLTAGPPLAGLMYDRLGSYDLAFGLSGGFVVLGLVLMFFIRLPSTVNRSNS